MSKGQIKYDPGQLSPFRRDFFKSDSVTARLGSGEIGGKASGLAFIKDSLLQQFDSNRFPSVNLHIPRFVVITTEYFDRFMAHNKLYEKITSGLNDERLKQIFLKAEIPPVMVGDLRGMIEVVNSPLALRSSSRLEDAMSEPFAGVYATKMIPNNQFDADTRFRRLVEGIKYVWASTFLKNASDYIKMTGKNVAEEKMAIVIQEIVGTRYSDRYYPHFSGVARSYNYYPVGRARPEEGVVDLALGLGKTIVDGGLVWSFSPQHPRVGPPVGSPAELLKLTQTKFWAVNMGKMPEHDPLREAEYLEHCELDRAEKDGTLTFLASTFKPQDNRIVAGTGSEGPRVINFASLLGGEEVPLANVIKHLLEICEEAVGAEVEIEFAATLQGSYKPKLNLGFLQVRPMVVAHEKIDVAEDELSSDNVFIGSANTMGNGSCDNLTDIVYVRPDIFEARYTPQIAGELDKINGRLISAGRRCLLIGFGRWGSSDPWLGIPVEWSQISSAAVIVEATLPEMNVELSQGSHFFHNLTSFGVFYLSVAHDRQPGINWPWLEQQKIIDSGEYVRHVRLEKPLTVKVDGRTRRGVVLK